MSGLAGQKFNGETLMSNYTAEEAEYFGLNNPWTGFVCTRPTEDEALELRNRRAAGYYY